MIEEIDPYTETKISSSYSSSLINDMKMISFVPNGIPIPFGSYIYRMQKYPGDIDLLQEFFGCCTESAVIKSFIKELHRVVKDILASKMHYMSEFKAGIDYRYDSDIGLLTDGVFIPSQNLELNTKNLYNKGLFNDNEFNYIMQILNNRIFTGDGYDIIFNIYRNRRIIRWSANEILEGFKISNGVKKTLYDALFDETHIKIDVIIQFEGMFTEITNFIGLVLQRKDGTIQNINIDLKKNHEIKKMLPPEIEKLYFSNYYYSPFKMVKRIFSLSRNKHDNSTLEKIIPLLQGDTSLLYQLKSEIDVLILIFERATSIPIQNIKKQLGVMKGRFEYIIHLPDEDRLHIYNTIDNIISVRQSRKNIYDQLKKLNKNVIIPWINKFTIDYLNIIGFNPPPKYLLPSQMSYEYIIRRPDEIPDI
jgi:hypothetical protein